MNARAPPHAAIAMNSSAQHAKSALTAEDGALLRSTTFSENVIDRTNVADKSVRDSLINERHAPS